MGVLHNEPTARYDLQSRTTRSVDTLLRYGANEASRNSDGETSSSFARWMLRTRVYTRGNGNGHTEAALEDEEVVSAIVRSLERGPAFRARSWLWPRVATEDGAERFWWIENPTCPWRRGQQKKKRFSSFAATILRYYCYVCIDVRQAGTSSPSRSRRHVFLS